MYVKVSRWGNSLGIRLPKMAVETLQLQDDDSVEVLAEGRSIIIRPAKITLEKLFEGYQGGDYDLYDWGELNDPAGRELL
ncbi:MAG: AbrB/MazE/SpoVT family DNA-binding domain-containing protein [Fusobacteriaceae bacterium]|jgi:antitoxin MazE|nr:AbrB/MazE/SpoVT family DNA-binding domain-containing protein [Fusobacteriaceae bacterium]